MNVIAWKNVYNLVNLISGNKHFFQHGRFPRWWIG